MIILDTNVISEPLNIDPDPSVVAWLNRQNRKTLFLTAINTFEVMVGIETMSLGKRRRQKTANIDKILEVFADRILPFDHSAAIANALLVARTRAAGKSIDLADSQIAAIAHVHGFSVATRDVGPFIAAGIVVINPWENHLQ